MEENDELLDGDNTNTSRKRSRASASSSSTDPGTVVPFQPNKRLKCPAHYQDRIGNVGQPKCFYCQLSGSIRGCEGTLLGPFMPPRTPRGKPSKDKPYFVHRNCVMWAPQAYEQSGKMRELDDVYKHMRGKKCGLCGDKAASLACMYRGASCCKPMHFRCALLAGASMNAGYSTLCPVHAKKEAGVNRLLLHENTPVENSLLFKGCVSCSNDSYDNGCGTIITCSICTSREHTLCIHRNLEGNGMFPLNSWNGKHLCKKCMRCATCEKPIDTGTYADQNRRTSAIQGDLIDDAHISDEPDSDETLLCIACEHFAIHVSCLADGDDKRRWRCDLCRRCRHCQTVDIPLNEWNEKYEACQVCFNEIQNGAVVCPVCVKVYREGENIAMVQCDFCDKWIHAVGCGGLTMPGFRKLEKNKKEKYRCPICVKDKKRREAERRKAKKGDSHAHVGLSKKVLQSILAQMTGTEEDVTFHTVRKISTREDSEVVWKQLCDDLAIGQELCKHCCSGGIESGLRFCADCGESFHPFCHNAKAGRAVNEEGSTDESHATFKRGRYGRTAVKAAYNWRCHRCERASRTAPSKQRISITAITSPYQPKSEPTMNGIGPYSTEGPKKETLLNGHSHRDANGIPVLDFTKGEHQNSGSCVDPISWHDKRVCILCKRKELRTSGHEGRLVPWGSSTMTDVGQVWVHVGCILFSTHVSTHTTANGYDVLLAPRRSLQLKASRTTCASCGLPGATLQCAVSDRCPLSYHFDCARTVGVACVVNISSKQTGKPAHVMTSKEDASVNLADIESIRIFCPAHRLLASTQVEKLPSLTECHRAIRTKRVLRILDRQGFAPNTDPPRRKPLSNDRTMSLRVGSLAVLRFGELFPDVNEFIVKDCLVPLGYCAARRFWSIVSKGQRCTYFLEVCGSRLTGPKFVIRCSDDPSFRVEHADPDIAWFLVVSRLAKLVNESFVPSQSEHCFRKLGLEAFGLLNCGPVLAHIESLPMASMFDVRYHLKVMAKHRDKTILFFNALADSYKGPVPKINRTGSARTEGYLPKRMIARRGKWGKNTPPQYQNSRTGAAFQLEVAREVLSGKKQTNLPENRWIPGDPKHVVQQNGRPRRSSATKERPKPAPKQRVRSKQPNAGVVVRSAPRCLAPDAKERTRILRSNIEGWGVFATMDIPSGQLIIEYVGEIIRPPISDLREKKYTDKGIGCYMFEIVTGRIVDATVCGNAARFINHSCAPNCYSKTIKVHNNQSVVAIYSKRNIQRGEELSYDYQFPFDDSDRVKCNCGADQCKGFMN